MDIEPLQEVNICTNHYIFIKTEKETQTFKGTLHLNK
jgi:hypothetical protein